MSICRCGKLYSGEMREVHFKFRNLVVCKYESGMMCDECSIDFFEKYFKLYAEGYVAIDNGQLVINWEQLLPLNKYGVRCNTILWLLTDLGKFSSQHHENYSVDVGCENANPRIADAGIKLYFTEEQDALDYALHAFPNHGGFDIYRL